MANYKPKCENCKRRKANAQRGLCRTCYEDTSIRNQYQEKKRGNRQGNVDIPDWMTDDLPPPKEPTGVDPGSEEKLAIMAKRAAAGRNIFHPEDFSFRD